MTDLMDVAYLVDMANCLIEYYEFTSKPLNLMKKPDLELNFNKW